MPSHRRFILLACASTLFLSFGASLGSAQQSAPLPTATVARIEIAGNKRFTSAQIIAASELHLGDPVSEAILADAARKLSQTGAFQEVRFTYKFASSLWDVQFQVIEAAHFLPCVFDNFIWFKDDDLIAVVRKSSPLFDGNFPESGNMKDNAIAALDAFLKEHNLPGSVSFTTNGSLGGQVTSYLVSVTDVAMPVLAVEVSGGPVTPDALLAAVHGVVGHNYSRFTAKTMSDTALTERYQDDGYLRPHFSDPIPALHDADGKDVSQGVIVKFTVTPGPQYLWNGVSWTGNSSLKTEDLEKTMAMSTGEIARREKTVAGWQGVRDAFGHIGFLALKMKATPSYDDSARSVHFDAQIDEGPQFTMGSLKVDDPSEKVVKMLSDAWKIHPGQIYDSLAEREFMKANAPKAIALSGTLRTRMTLRRDLRPETHSVDVHLGFQ
jgi:outer membrane protein assembly factor BamA